MKKNNRCGKGETRFEDKRAMVQQPESEVKSGEVASGEVANGEVKSGEVASGEVANGEVKSGEVASGEVASGEVASGEVANGEVKSGEVANGEVKSGEVARGEVKSDEVANGEVASGESKKEKEKSEQSGLKGKLILVVSGIATGFANGFFGGGGGMVTVPVLAKLLKYEEKKAHATALLVILPISIFSSISYIVKGSIDWSTAAFVAIGVLSGGILGAVFLKKISNKVLTYLFAVIMIAVGVKMFI